MNIVLREYEHKDKSQLGNCDLSGLSKFLKKNNLPDVISITPSGIKTNHFVGVLNYKNTQIEILPKVLSTDKTDITIIKNLIFMLSYTRKMKITVTDNAKILKSTNPFLEILIREYATSLFDALKRSFPRGYNQVSDNVSFVKGKINFCEHIKYNSINRARFYCEYDEFSENIVLNQLFLFVSKSLLYISNDAANKRILSHIINYYSDINLVHFTSEMAQKVSLTKVQKPFEKALDLAKMFLAKSSIDMTKNQIRSVALLWNMNVLFEEFIYEVLNRKCGESVKAESQKEKKLLRGAAGKKRRTKVDILITSPKKMIIDTKYKQFCSIDNFANSDVFQVSTYCLLHDAHEAVLLYPQWGKTKPEVPDFELNTDLSTYKIRFCTVNLHIDLKNNLELLVQELNEIIHL